MIGKVEGIRFIESLNWRDQMSNESVIVKGEDVSDIRSRISGSRDESAWLNINPSHSDYGRVPDGFRIDWRGSSESFSRVVQTPAELFEVLRPIVLAYDKQVRDAKKAETNAKRRAHAESLKQAKAVVKKLEAEEQ